MKELELPLQVLSQQGFEATHKWHKSIYFHATSHDGAIGKSRIIVSSMKQILGKMLITQLMTAVKIYRMHFIQAFETPTRCKSDLHLQ